MADNAACIMNIIWSSFPPMASGIFTTGWRPPLGRCPIWGWNRGCRDEPIGPFKACHIEVLGEEVTWRREKARIGWWWVRKGTVMAR